MSEPGTRSTSFERYGWVLVCAFPFLCALLIRGPIPIDETRYLSVAWEMWSNGDFALPMLNGVPYTHKPPVLFWLMHLGWSVFGVNSWWPRSVPFLAALASTWLTRRLARSLYPEAASRVPDTAAWLLAGTIALTAYVTVMLFDWVLVACVMVALVALERADRAPVSSGCLYTGALAAGLLTKGPAMLVFALSPALLGPWWNANAARHPLRWYGGITIALLVALAAGSLWVLSAFQQTGAGFVRTILWDQSATRIVHSFAHAHPWWFYLLLFPVLLLPWLVWPTTWRSLRMSGAPRADRLAIATFVPSFVIFSLISGKQPHYLLPLVPVAALWLAPRVASPAMTLGGSRPVALFFLLLGAAGAATALWAEPVNTRLATGFTTMACALLFLRVPLDRYAALRRLALATAATMGLVTIAFYLAIGESYRLEGAARVVQRLDETGSPIAWIGPYAGQLNFLARLRRPITELDAQRTDEVAQWVAAHPSGHVVAFSSYGCELHIGPELYRQRYRSGWLVIVPANAAHYAPRACDEAKGRKPDEAADE